MLSGEHLLQKWVSAPAAPRKLFGRIESRMDSSPELFFDRAEAGEQILEREVASNDQKVDVAPRSLFTSCHRTINQGEIDPLGKRTECRPDRIGDAYRLGDDAAQFLENRSGTVRLVVFLAADEGHGDQAALDQARQFALNRAGTRTGSLDQLLLEERAVRLPEKEAQEALLRFSEERVAQ